MTEAKRMPKVMPEFVFERLRHIEIEAGYILAGTLIVDIPKGKSLNKRRQRRVNQILQMLTDMVQSGQMPNDAMIYCWPPGQTPTNADAITDDESLMTQWVKTRMAIGVRAGNDGFRADSDMMRQLGYSPSGDPLH